MLLGDLKLKFGDYRNTPKNKTNKALSAKIKVIPTHKAFRDVMYKIGISQTKKQYARLISSDCDFKIEEFSKNNTIKLSKDTVIFNDFIDDKKYKIPHNTLVDVYTRKTKSHNRKYLDVAYIHNDKILIINKIEE